MRPCRERPTRRERPRTLSASARRAESGRGRDDLAVPRRRAGDTPKVPCPGLAVGARAPDLIQGWARQLAAWLALARGTLPAGLVGNVEGVAPGLVGVAHRGRPHRLLGPIGSRDDRHRSPLARVATVGLSDPRPCSAPSSAPPRISDRCSGRMMVGTGRSLRADCPWRGAQRPPVGADVDRERV